MTLSQLTSLLAIGLPMVNCTSHVRSSNSNLGIPFNAGLEGASLTTSLDVRQRTYFDFNLNIAYDENNEHSRLRALDFAGSGQTLNGKRINNGVGIPLHITIMMQDSSGHNIVVVDKTSLVQEFAGSVLFSYAKTIVSLTLDPGVYQVKVTAMGNTPLLNDTPIYFDSRSPSRK